MLDSLKKLINDQLTEKDNSTFCIVRVSFFLIILSFIGESVYHLYAGHIFDPVNFGAGAAALLGSGGASVGIKSKLGGDSTSDDTEDVKPVGLQPIKSGKPIDTEGSSNV